MADTDAGLFGVPAVRSRENTLALVRHSGYSVFLSMLSRQDRERLVDAQLAPYAVKNEKGLGRHYASIDKDDERRLRFEIDKGRITHSEAFRRLEKTQVYANIHTVRHLLSTRWSHTIEVADLALNIGNVLGLNGVLSETIGRAHDFGHPPFGHQGESEIRKWMSKDPWKLSFEHNEQSLRIVTLLEPHAPEYPGLNLNIETVEGMQKHRLPGDPGYLRSPSLEAQVTDKADAIAYTERDIHDGLMLGVLSRKNLADFELYRKGLTTLRPELQATRTGIIHLLANDLVDTTSARWVQERIETLEDVYAAKAKLVVFSESAGTALRTMKKYLYETMYNPASKEPFKQAIREVLHTLCEHQRRFPSEETEHYRTLSTQPTDELKAVEAAKDYVCSLTDERAYQEARKLGVTEEVLEHVGMIFRP